MTRFFSNASLLGLLLIGSSCRADTGTARQWTLWAPGNSPQIVVSAAATPAERDAATELQKYIGKSSGTAPALVTEAEARPDRVIYVGRTRVADLKQIEAASPGGDAFEAARRDEIYRIESNPARRSLALYGGSDMGTKFAVYGFLERYCGVRWYMPTDLFEVVPRRATLTLPAVEKTEVPAFAPRLFAYMWHPSERVSYTGERDPQFNGDRWIVRNRLSADGRLLPRYHSHNLSNVILPSRDFEAHPDWFPMLGGKRFRPPSDHYPAWQPELTNAEVVQKFIAAGREFFRKNPHQWQWFSLGINDGEGWSESAEAQKANGPLRAFRGVWVRSETYYSFVNTVAAALLKEFPDRKVGVIAYAGVLVPPRTIERLQPNVNVVVCQESAQQFETLYRDEDTQIIRDWMRVANGNVYRYDYQSLGWTMPRYFPSLVAEEARRMKSLGVKGRYTEDVPYWAIMGPLLWMTSQLYWNPEQNERELNSQFSRDLFGKAAGSMDRYFGALETVWMRPRAGRFLYGLGDIGSQAALYSREDRLKLGRLVAEAVRTSRSGVERQRVEFFVQGWQLVENYLQQSEQVLQINAASGAARTRAAVELIQLLETQDTWTWKFDKQDPLLSASFRAGDAGVWGMRNWRRTMLAVAAAGLADGLREEANGDTQRWKARLTELRATHRSELAVGILDTVAGWNGDMPSNALKNPAFQSKVPFDLYPNNPESWVFWRNVRGTISTREGSARVTGADDAAILQSVTVPANQWVRISVKYRTNVDYAGQVYLRTDGGAGGPAANAEASSGEREISVLVKGPVKDSSLRLLLSVKNQRAQDWVEFSQPYVGMKSAAPAQ